MTLPAVVMLNQYRQARIKLLLNRKASPTHELKFELRRKQPLATAPHQLRLRLRLKLRLKLKLKLKLPLKIPLAPIVLPLACQTCNFMLAERCGGLLK